MSSKFKKLVVQGFSLREDEPLVDFVFLWVILSVFMGMIDTIGIAKHLSPRIDVTLGAGIAQVMLL